MRLRNLDLRDVDTITEIDALCFPPGVAFPRETFAECVASPECECFGLEEDNLLAFAILHFPGPRSAQIITLDVRPERRRQGLGRSLLAEVERRSRQRGARRIYLQVAPHNQPALSLYQAAGYTLRATLPDYYGPGQPAHLMDKSLSV